MRNAVGGLALRADQWPCVAKKKKSPSDLFSSEQWQLTMG